MTYNFWSVCVDTTCLIKELTMCNVNSKTQSREEAVTQHTLILIY